MDASPFHLLSFNMFHMLNITMLRLLVILTLLLTAYTQHVSSEEAEELYRLYYRSMLWCEMQDEPIRSPCINYVNMERFRVEQYL